LFLLRESSLDAFTTLDAVERRDALAWRANLLAKRAICFAKSFLNWIFGLLAIMRDTARNSQQLAVVPSYNLFEGCDTASLRRVHES
jgi:hypothetical protein